MMGFEPATIKTEPELIIEDSSNTDIDIYDSYEVTDANQSIKSLKKTKHKEGNSERKQIKFKCENCDKRFDQKAAKERHHLLVHTYERPFSCDICKNTFVDKSCVRNHMQQHIQYYCPICNQPFRHAFNIKRHMLVHNGLRPYPCTQCERTYKHSSHLKRHLRHHEDGGNYQDTKPLREKKANKLKNKTSINTNVSTTAMMQIIESKPENVSVPYKNVDVLEQLTQILR